MLMGDFNMDCKRTLGLMIFKMDWLSLFFAPELYSWEIYRKAFEFSQHFMIISKLICGHSSERTKYGYPFLKSEESET